MGRSDCGGTSLSGLAFLGLGACRVGCGLRFLGLGAGSLGLGSGSLDLSTRPGCFRFLAAEVSLQPCGAGVPLGSIGQLLEGGDARLDVGDPPAGPLAFGGDTFCCVFEAGCFDGQVGGDGSQPGAFDVKRFAVSFGRLPVPEVGRSVTGSRGVPRFVFAAVGAGIRFGVVGAPGPELRRSMCSGALRFGLSCFVVLTFAGTRW